MNCPPLPPLPSPPKPLPQVPGPKLAPFTPTAYADIEFVEVLSDPEDNMHSYICEVRLNKEPRPYVLKMVGSVPGPFSRSVTGINSA